MDHGTTKEDAEAWHQTDNLHAKSGKGDPFAAAIRATRMSMIVTDPRQPDNPIVFANNAFLRLTGYDRGEVVGRNCRFLQGVDTDPEAVEQIRAAVEAEESISIDILNYRKDGSSFWNALYMSPVKDEKGVLQFFFASQIDVSDRKASQDLAEADKERFERAVAERTSELKAALEAKTTLLHEVDHRVKNNLQMVSSLILMQSRSIADESIKASLKAMLERIEALSTVHRRLYQSDDVSSFDVADFVRDLVTDIVAASGRKDIDADLQLKPVRIPAAKAAPVALIVNELVTNALKHGFKGERPGTIHIHVRDGDGRLRIDVADDGAGMVGEPSAASFGTKLVRSLSRQLQAEIEWQEGSPGTRVVLSMPVETARKGEH